MALPFVTPRALVHTGLCALSTVVLVTIFAQPAAAVGPRAQADLVSGLADTARQSLEAYMGPRSTNSARYYANGVWHATDGPSCWYCYDSAAVAAATISRQPGANPAMRRVAIATFNSAIARHQLRSGAFSDATGTADEIGTGFFTVDLGVTYLELRRVLDRRTRNRWRRAVQRAADSIIRGGDMTWYVNGNVNLRQTEVMWLAWTITGQSRFRKAYNAEWAFTISPPPPRWRGFGLRVTRRPTRRDGRDGSGYLAESSGGAPGYDPSYTDAQLDTATDLYVLTHDRRYIRLMNLEFNQLRPRIDAAWTLDATAGSRRSYLTPFMNPAVSVLAASGDRPDLAPRVSAQLERVESEYRSAESYTNPNFYKGFEAWISMPLLNQQWPAGMASGGEKAHRHRVSESRH